LELRTDFDLLFRFECDSGIEIGIRSTGFNKVEPLSAAETDSALTVKRQVTVKTARRATERDLPEMLIRMTISFQFQFKRTGD
jgi:hypothetical protein